jgi:alkylation response protein AidB-like acyl-CoA dehydrogenase
VTLLAVEASAPGVEITPVTSLDLTRPIATVTLSSAPARVVAVFTDPADVGDAAVVGRADAGVGSAGVGSAGVGTAGVGGAGVADALAFASGLLASEQLGVAEWCLAGTVAYVKERTQFARPIGSFQAVKHRLADLWLEIVGARAAARNAADRLAHDGSAAVTVAVAQAHCASVAVHAAEECVQLHGGIGMTWEHPAHLYLKRAKASEIALGSPGAHREALAALVELPPPD